MDQAVTEHLDGLAPETADRVRALLAAVLRAAPDGTVHIAYGMPSVRLDGRHAFSAGAWKAHIGFYPVYPSDHPIEQELAPYRSGKDTLRFRHDRPLPVELVERAVVLQLERARPH